jgi:class 3 adenylate cyclase
MVQSRKLAAILVADVVGFSRLVGSDEERTLARLRSLWGDFVDPAISTHRGHMIKRTGDGGIFEFRSVVDAVRCGIELQTGLIERNSGVSRDLQIKLRVGIHIGDVVEEEDGDLMGDGVNIASRLEGIAEPGTVLLSEDAYRQVKSRLDLIVQDLGEVQLKNIAERVRVYSLRVSEAPTKAPRRVQSKRVWLAAGAIGIVAAAAGSVVLFVSNHTPQLSSSRVDLPLSCTSLKEYSDRSKAKNAQLMSTPVGDKTLQCDLKRDVLQSSQAVYLILEDDPQKCGVRDEVIDRVKTANDTLLKNIQSQCGSSPQR